MLNREILQGEKVLLSPIVMDDCEDFVRWRNSEFVQENFIYRKKLTVEEQKNWIENKVNTGEVVQYIIWTKKDNKKIGSVYLQKFDNKKESCEFGILIGEKDYLGQGLGREANQLICEYAFEKIGVETIYLRVLEKNIRAKKSYLKAGYEIDLNRKDQIEIDGKLENVVFMVRRKGIK